MSESNQSAKTPDPQYQYQPSPHFVPPPNGQFGQVPVLHGPPGIDNQPINQSTNQPIKRSRSRSPLRHDPYRPATQTNEFFPVQNTAMSIKHKEFQRMEYAKTVKAFWAKQKQLIETTDYKKLKHDLPLARIKKIMKSDDEVRMISAEVPILFSKACELFILDLTMRAWSHTSDTNRRTLQRSDVADAIMEGEGMDFLVDIVPREDDNSQSNLPGHQMVMPRTHHDHEPDVDGQSNFTTDSLLRRMEKEISGQRAMAAVPSSFPQNAHMQPMQHVQPMQSMHMQQMNMGTMHR